jgi:hypothetical protein
LLDFQVYGGYFTDWIEARRMPSLIRWLENGKIGGLNLRLCAIFQGYRWMDGLKKELKERTQLLI